MGLQNTCRSVVVVTAWASLAGCGSEASSGVPTANPTQAPEVVVQVSGAYTGTFEHRGSIYCSSDGLGGEEFELYAMKMPEQFNLRMPRGTAPGVHTITDGAGAPIDFYYSDPHRQKYEQITSATIRLDAVPQAQGERLIGTIEATLETDEGQSVEVVISLDLDAGHQSFDECG